jgi:hypothetical protein
MRKFNSKNQPRKATFICTSDGASSDLICVEAAPQHHVPHRQAIPQRSAAINQRAPQRQSTQTHQRRGVKSSQLVTAGPPCPAPGTCGGVNPYFPTLGTISGLGVIPEGENFARGPPQCDKAGMRIDASQILIGTNQYDIGVWGGLPAGLLILTITTADQKTFDWSANRPGITTITVKGGGGGSSTYDSAVYYYDGSFLNATCDTCLHSPLLDQANGQIPNISHIDICFDPDVVVLAGLQISKTAATRFDRQYKWSINKRLTTVNGQPFNDQDPDYSQFSQGQTATLGYTVSIPMTGTADFNHEVYGTITIINTNPPGFNLDITLDDLTDVISSGHLVSLDFDVDGQLLLAGESLQVNYIAALPSALNGINTATVTATYNETQDAFTTTQTYDFAEAQIEEINRCVPFSDNLQVRYTQEGYEIYDDLGQITATEVCSPGTELSYTTDIQFQECGEFVYINKAALFSPNEPLYYMYSQTFFPVIVTGCGDGGCTLTQGYWKTHSARGPAPYDDTWAQLPQSENTPFFTSGKSYYQVLQTAPQGNAYYILAHQYIAAELNQLNGASIPATVLSAYNAATTLFQNPAYTPAYIGGLKGSNALRNQYLSYAKTLDDYNNGLTGPGHCTE